jgi:hypothetical protein
MIWKIISFLISKVFLQYLLGKDLKDECYMSKILLQTTKVKKQK